MNPLQILQGFIQFCIKFEYFKRNSAPVARTNVSQLFDSSLMKQSNLLFPQMELSIMNNPLSSEVSPRSSKRKYTSDTDTQMSTDSARPSKHRKTTSEDQCMDIDQDYNVHESTEFESKTGDANDSRNITLQRVKVLYENFEINELWMLEIQKRDESLEQCLELETSPNQLELRIQREIQELEEKFQAEKKEYLRKKKTLQFKLLELRNNKINGNMPRQTVEATIVDVPKDSETFRSKRFLPIEEEMLLHFIYDELQKEKSAQDIGYLKQIEKDYKVQLALDDYGFLTSWRFENQEDVETDKMMMKEAPKIQLFYLSKNDKKKNESIWRAIKERRTKRWIVFDYNFVPEPDDFMYLEGDATYGDTDQSMTREPNYF